MMRTIEQIDRDIDANRRALMARLHCNPECSAQAWQNAWDRCPDLHAKERALFAERGAAQVVRNVAAEKEHARQQRLSRAIKRKSARTVRKCPTCGFHTFPVAVQAAGAAS